MKTIQIDRDLYNYIVSKAAEPGESPSLILRRELHLPQPTETLEVDDDIYSYLLSKAESFGESASDILRHELNADGEPHHDAPDTIVFHIPAGTGSQPGNTREHAVVAKAFKFREWLGYGQAGGLPLNDLGCTCDTFTLSELPNLTPFAC